MFFTARERELAMRRARLRQQSAAVRDALAADAQVFAAPLQLAERVRAGWRWLRAHPDAVLAAVAVFVVVRPRRAWSLMRWAWRGWRTWRWVLAAAPAWRGERTAARP